MSKTAPLLHGNETQESPVVNDLESMLFPANEPFSQVMYATGKWWGYVRETICLMP